MKHTIGYTTTAEFPVAISYKCLYCGADNTRTVYLQSKEFDFSKAGSSSAARIALQEKLDSLIEASSVEELKNAGLHCVCKKCGKAPPWTDNRLSAGTSIRIGFFAILAIIIALVAFFSGNSAIGEWSSSIIESGLLPIVIPVAIIVIIGLVVLVSSFTPKKQAAPLPEESMPKIIAFGEEAKKYAPPRSSIYN